MTATGRLPIPKAAPVVADIAPVTVEGKGIGRGIGRGKNKGQEGGRGGGREREEEGTRGGRE